MQRMSHDSVRKELDKWAAQEKDDAAAVQIAHGDQFLSSRAENFWAACFAFHLLTSGIPNFAHNLYIAL